MRNPFRLFFSAVQFLTRLPVPVGEFRADDLPRSLALFPLVGLLLAAGGLLVRFLLAPHLGNGIVVLAILLYLVLLTGGLHEDGLADAADGFGGGWNKEQMLAIMRDSRIGSYGAVAIVFSLLGRFVLLTELPATKFVAYFATSLVLSRWAPLPLSFFLSPARADSGQGSRVAGKVSWPSLLFGTFLAFGIAALFLHTAALWVGLTAAVIALVTGLYYHQRLGGVTGDCLGATVQLTEIGVYLAGLVVRG
ncbi:MAG: adenosylcobinamide-GDP ribazoletransferase [Acidobacteria bacterium]|nr:adenosylcobinamide-GDP ribazoletransferase [Acidobacteriota bacterium]